MAKDNASTILILGGLGVAVYGYFQGWFASFGLSAPVAAPATVSSVPTSPTSTVASLPVATPTTAVAPIVSTPGTPTAVTAGTPATPSNTPAVYTAFQAVMAAAVGADPAVTGSASNPTATPDVFNWYLVNGQSMVQFGITGGPSSATYFSTTGQDTSTPISLNAYWAVTGPWLQSNYGLSGVYAGLGALAQRQRRGW